LANGQGIDSTTDSVNSLGDAIDSASKKAGDSGSVFNDMVFGLAGFGAVMAGVLAGMKAFVDYAGRAVGKEICARKESRKRCGNRSALSSICDGRQRRELGWRDGREMYRAFKQAYVATLAA
jgi:hypothetical protein